LPAGLPGIGANPPFGEVDRISFVATVGDRGGKKLNPDFRARENYPYLHIFPRNLLRISGQAKAQEEQIIKKSRPTAALFSDFAKS
jgi:hypothetical protein